MSCENSILDRDQTFMVHDFGPRGHVANLTVSLTHGLQPGGMIGAVVLADKEVYITILDANQNILLHFGGIIASNQLLFNSRKDDIWGVEEKAVKNPLVKGVRTSVSLIYEEEGYRIFVNGKEQIFYKHRFDSRPDHVLINEAQVFKVIYHTTMNIIP